MKMERFKNYGLWVAVASLVGLILQNVGVIETPEQYQVYVDSILNILVLAGIVINPSIGKGYTDEV